MFTYIDETDGLGLGRGVYTIEALEQMLHEKCWGKDFSQSWGGRLVDIIIV